MTEMEKPEEADEKMEVIPSTENDEPSGESVKSLSENQWAAMRSVLETLYKYRDEDGHDPSRAFHKNVNRRNVPSYYDVIKEPIAMSNIKANVANRTYKGFKQFVRECALIWHNAHTFNRPEAGAFQDASVLIKLMEDDFQKLVDKKIVTANDVEWPDLGEIPPVEDALEEAEVAEEGADEEEEEEEDEEEDEDEAEDSDEGAGRKKRRGRQSTTGKRAETQRDEVNGQKRRGRPPKVDTPMEARMKNVLKALRRPRDKGDGQFVRHFEKLPDKASMPEYFAEIKRPISVEQIKKSLKRRRYKTFDAFLGDLSLMFNNAKEYNEDGSDIFEAAAALETEAQRVAEVEMKKPDSDLTLGDGRTAMPDGIKHNGELWKVGDWVHIQNANNVTKPIVAQIYKMWVDKDEQPWVNACWYYRPDQTVHHYEKHFWAHEVVKTGQYRDHPIEDIVGRCFVMFHTRYFKGRPEGVPADRDVYICHFRYNEEKRTFNQIKTWTSCLPEDVRDQNYRTNSWPEGSEPEEKKFPSPLMWMLEEEGKVTNQKPASRWGAENAPPVEGGVFTGPRPEGQSPPPSEPTPPPSPTPPVRQPSLVAPTSTSDMPSNSKTADSNAWDDNAARAAALVSTSNPPIRPQSRPSYPAQHPHSQNNPASPVQQAQRPSNSRHASSYGQGGGHPALAASTPHAPAHDQYTTPRNHYLAAHQQPTPLTPGRYPTQSASGAAAAASALQPGRQPNEVFTLPDQADAAAFPDDIRARFQRNEEGKVLFFSKAPVVYQDPPPTLGHSARYRAAKLRREMALNLKRKEAPTAADTNDAAHGANATIDSVAPPAKRPSPTPPVHDEAIHNQLVAAMERQVAAGLAKLGKEDTAAREQRERDARWEETRKLLRGPSVFLDDIDPRY